MRRMYENIGMSRIRCCDGCAGLQIKQLLKDLWLRGRHPRAIQVFIFRGNVVKGIEATNRKQKRYTFRWTFDIHTRQYEGENIY